MRRYLTVGVLLLTPSMMALLSFVQAVLPKYWKVPFLVQCSYEAIAIWCLLQLFLDFLGRNHQEVLTVLDEADPQRLWAAFPCCCLALLPGAAPRTAGAWDLALVKALVFQYILVHIVLSALKTLVEYEGRPLPVVVFFLVRLPSLAGLVLGCLALLRAGRGPLGGRRCQGKLWLLQGFLILQLVSRGLVLRHCGSSPGQARAVACALAGLLALPFALGVRLVYTPSDLSDCQDAWARGFCKQEGPRSLA